MVTSLLEFNIRLYDKNSESGYFFFLHQNQNIFFSNIGNQNIFLEKNHNPPFKLNGRSLTHCATRTLGTLVYLQLLLNFHKLWQKMQIIITT